MTHRQLGPVLATEETLCVLLYTIFICAKDLERNQQQLKCCGTTISGTLQLESSYTKQGQTAAFKQKGCSKNP